MSIDDDIKALRERHPYLSQFSDDQIAREGFLKVPDFAMQEFSDIKSQYLKLDEETRKEREKTLYVKTMIDPLLSSSEDPEEYEAIHDMRYELDVLVPELPKVLTPEYQQVQANALDILRRAMRGDYDGLTPDNVEAAVNVVFNPTSFDDKTHTLLTAKEAEESVATKLYRSIIPYIEPLDYPRGISWSALAYAGDILPDSDSWIGQLMEEATGVLGKGVAYAAPSMVSPAGTGLSSFATNLSGISGLGDLAGRNLYEAVASGKAADSITEFHGDGIPFVDFGYRLPNLTGPEMMDIVLPKDEVATLKDKAEREGASELQVEFLNLLATSDAYRTVAGLIPEVIVDPLWLAGPAMSSQVINKGGKAFLVGPDLVKASRAALGGAELKSQKLDDILRLGVESVEGSEEALATFSKVAEEFKNHAIAKDAASDALLKASKASPEKVKESAISELVNATERLTERAEDIKWIMRHEGKANEVAMIDSNLVEQVATLTRIGASIQDKDDLAELFLKNRARSLKSQSVKYRSSAETINRFVKIVVDGGSPAQRQAQINRGYSFHVPLTSRQWNVNPSELFGYYKYEDGLKLKPRPGDTAQSIAGYVGLNPIDLVRLNGLESIEDLERAVQAGEKIVYQIGYKPTSLTKNFGMSILPEGLVAAYMKGLAPIPVVERLGDFRRYMSTSNAERIKALQKANKKTTLQDEFSLLINRIIGRPVNVFVDKFYQLFGSRFMQPLLASKTLERAMRYFENRSIKDVRELENPRQHALIRLRTVAPELWNAYQDSVTSYFRAVASDNEAIHSFMNGIMRQANEIALVRTSQGKQSEGIEVLEEVMHAIESGQGSRLTKDELALKNQLVDKMSEVSSVNSVEREAVRQSMMNMIRFVTTDPKTLANQVEGVKRLELLLEQAYTTGLAKTIEREAELKAQLTTLKSIRLKSAVKKEVVSSIKSAIGELKKTKKALKSREIVDGKLVEVVNPRVKKAIDEIQSEVVSLSEEIARRAEEVAKSGAVLDGKVMITAPRFPVPTGKSTAVYTRPMLRWEITLWSQFQDILSGLNSQRIEAGLEEMSQQEVFKGVMAIFQESPSALKDPEIFRETWQRYVGVEGMQVETPKPLSSEKAMRFTELEKQIDEILIKSPNQRTADDKANLSLLRSEQDQLYLEQWETTGGFVPQVIGQRFAALPEDIKDITEAMSQMFQKYEGLYKKYGRDFTKDPLERMQLWGVVGYVPHMRKVSVNPIGLKEKIEAFFTKGQLDQRLSLTLDQAKNRKINGLIAEINALPKSSDSLANWEFSADPNMLMAHFMSGQKSLTNEDFLVALLKGGVIRTFGTIDEAAKVQYIPLFDNGEYARDMQILLLGASGEIAQLISSKGTRQNYLEKFRTALQESLNNQNRLGQGSRPLRSWADDIAALRETDSVEQSLSGVNIHAAVRGQPTFNPITRAQTIVDDLMAAHVSAIKAQIKQTKDLIEEAKLSSKSSKKLVERRLALEERIRSTSESYVKARKKAESKAWTQVTNELNTRVAQANNEIDPAFKVSSIDGRLPNVSTKSLQTYFSKDQELFRLYIPATVQEAMSRQFGDVVPFEFMKEEGALKGFFDMVNSWWKARITVLSLAFTARNFIGNLFSNSLDIGLFGALNPKTNAQAYALSVLVDYHAKYGSIDKALEALKRPKVKRDLVIQTKGVDTKAQLLREEVDLLTTLKIYGVSKGSDLIDVGDGILRSVDDVLADLQQRGVMSGSGTYRVDVDEVAYEMQRMAASMGVKEATGQASKAPAAKGNIASYAGAIEDAVYMGLPFLMGAPFVGVPKFLGKTIARRTENQARATNFIANLKRGKTAEEAADHVNKFLFDYGDLTVAQKRWIRTLIPFFTWNQKNILLHMELMQTNPTYYAQFYRFFYVVMPEVIEANERDKAAAEGLNIVTRDVRKVERERIRTGPGYRAFRIGVNIDRANNIMIQGFGLPLEGFAQNVGTANSIIDAIFSSARGMFGKSGDLHAPFREMSPYAAQTHVALRALIELPFKYDVFREQAITDRSGYDYKDQYVAAYDFGNLVQKLTEYSNPAIASTDINRIPSNGAAHSMAQYIINALDMVPVRRGDKIFWEVHNPRMITALRTYRMTPYERLLREAATVTDFNQTMLMTPELVEAGEKSAFRAHELAWMQRYLAAYTGMKFKQDAPLYLQEKMYRQNVIRELINYHRQMLPDDKGE